MTAHLAFLLAAGCSMALGQAQSVSGTVINSVDSTPIAGAKVTLSSRSGIAIVLTDNGGRFYIDGVPEGAYYVAAERPGYFASDAKATLPYTFVSAVPEKTPDPIVLPLTPGAVLTGHITDENGYPLTSATVSLI